MGLNTNASCHEVLLQNEQWFRRPEDGYARRKGGGQHSVTNDQGVWLVFLLAPEDCSSVSTFKGVCSILEESRPLLFLLENVDGMETKSAKDSEEVPSAVPVGLSWKLKLDWIWIVFFSECFVLSLRRSQFCHGNSSILTFAPRLMTHDSENDFSHPVYGFRQVETVAKSFFSDCPNTTCAAILLICDELSSRHRYVNWPAKPQDRFARSNMELVLQYLRSLLYYVTWFRIWTCSYGLPQRRCRIYFFGAAHAADGLGSRGPVVLKRIPKLLTCMQCELKLKPAPSRSVSQIKSQLLLTHMNHGQSMVTVSESGYDWLYNLLITDNWYLITDNLITW